MASFDLESFRPAHHLSVVVAIEAISSQYIQIGFWINDPTQQVDWPVTRSSILHRQDFLWQQTCFECFIGVKDQSFYREINLSTAQLWQAYGFEEYRYPEQMPPVAVSDIEVMNLERTGFGLTAHIDVAQFLANHSLRLTDLRIGCAAILKDKQQQSHFFAMRHSAKEADFHNQHDWLYAF